MKRPYTHVPTTNGNKPWTSKEEDKMREAYLQGLSAEAIGEKLGRSPKSISARMCKLRKDAVSLMDPRQSEFTLPLVKTERDVNPVPLTFSPQEDTVVEAAESSSFSVPKKLVWGVVVVLVTFAGWYLGRYGG
jgi:hypothetical protein|tara:strand:+ start:1941 stop:2339 length:399 start_codon:yes stop_codon:yes gene_type:complete